jgi:aspartyl-tRNA(Asn)/glutamyl-tRNA(Gln) amidotransferase subunit C
MEISKEEIKHLANLSNLNFTNEEIEDFEKDFVDILKFVEQIKDVDTPNDLEYDLKDFEELREDVVNTERSLSQEEVLINAPSKKQGSFAVPLMME